MALKKIEVIIQSYILSLYYHNLSIWTNYYVWNMMILYYIATHYMEDVFTPIFLSSIFSYFCLPKVVLDVIIDEG